MTHIKTDRYIKTCGGRIMIDENGRELICFNSLDSLIAEISKDACAELRTALEQAQQDLQFVERWANHHGAKPNVTAKEALSCIQHYPAITAITRSYKDGEIPNPRNPWAELEQAQKRIAELEAQPIEPAQEPYVKGWKHSCNALLTDGIELWVNRCPHCGKPATQGE